MSAPISLPVVPPQPDQEIYSPQYLSLFQEYTRESYRAAFAEEAPPWDPARLYKSWFDSSATPAASATPVGYQVFGQDTGGEWGFVNMTLTAADASSVNLPGAIVYPQYVIAPTEATRGGSGLSANYLSLEADARALMLSLSGTGLVDQGNTAVFPVIYPANEPRRMWAIIAANANQLNVGLLLAERNAGGIGSPGHWDLAAENSPGGYPIWSADPPAATGFDDARPHRPVPVRPLLPNERIGMQTIGILGAIPVIMRADLGQEHAELGGQFTPSDRKILSEIYRIVGKLGL